MDGSRLHQPASKVEPRSTDDYLETAGRIAHHICASAIPLATEPEPRCTWQIRAPDDDSQIRRSRPQEASGLLYQGTSGMAYFLAQAYAVTGEPELAETARAAIHHALDQGRALANNAWGMHSGRTGIAWAAAHIAQILDDESLSERAFALLEPLVGNAHRDHGLDVIAGAAGAIPALLDLRSLADGARRDELLSMAEQLGDHLLARAHQEPAGWSWPTLPQSAVRNLVGFAHGTSGIAVALLELAMATGRGDFRFAADMALLYERQFFDPAQDNWPDLRNVPLGELVRRVPGPQLQAMAKAGALPPYERSLMLAWCHGSPGIGLARLRAWELTGRREDLDTLTIAMRSTLRSLAPETLAQTNFSLCHGTAGNAEPALCASMILDHPQWRASCEAAAAWGMERHTAGAWPCGTFDGASDPSLLLGEAGIGLFFLRLARPEIPTPLLLRPHHPSGASLPTEGYGAAAEQSIHTYFAQTLKRWSSLGTVPEFPTFEPKSTTPEQTPAAVAYGRLCEQAESSPLHADAFLVERRMYEKQVDLGDFTRELVDALARPTWQEVQGSNDLRFVLTEDVDVVVTDHDWAGPQGPQGPPPEATPALIGRKDNRFFSRPIAPLSAVVLQACREPASVPAIRERVAEALGGEAGPESLVPVVDAQLQQLYAAGFLSLAAERTLPA